MKYRAEIDGLRALAVLPVILFHAGFDWFSGGFIGVDVFFVISGYLITTIIVSELAEGTFSLLNFYERRARRILPALFGVMLVCLPFAFTWLTPADLGDFGESLIAVSTFSSNILFWLESGYFDTAAELKPLLHTWSLAVEEQFYILFPLVLLLFWRMGARWLISLLVVTLLLSLGVAHWGATSNIHPKIISGSFYLLPTRGWELLMGALVAFYLRYNTYLKSDLMNQLLSLLGLGMIVFAIVVFDKSTPFPSLYALVPTLGTALLILSAVPNTLAHRVLTVSPLIGLGLISYSAYLWHQPILAFARHRLILQEISGFQLISLCLLSLVFAYFSWNWVEKPFREKRKISARSILTLSLVGMVTFISFGVLSEFVKPQSELTFDRSVYESERDLFMSEHNVSGEERRDSARRHYAVVGDSMWKDAVNIVGQIGDFDYTSFGYGGCPITDEFKNYNLASTCINENKRRFSEDYSRFDGVIIISRYSWFDPLDLSSFLQHLKLTGATNVLVFGNYLGFKDQSHYMDRVALRLGGKENVDRSLDRAHYLELRNMHNEPFEALQKSYDFEYISIVDTVCENECKLFINEIPFTYDVHHFTLEFSNYISHRNRHKINRFLAR